MRTRSGAQASDRTVSLSERTYERLKQFAEPLEDTPEDVISRALDAYETAVDSNGVNRIERNELLRPNPHDPGSLKYSKVMDGHFASRGIRNWNDLIRTAHRVAMEQLGSYGELVQVSLSNIEEGEKTDSGYTYLPDVDLSVQSHTADYAWKYALHLAKEIEVPIEVMVRWPDRDDAAYPGQRAELVWEPDEG